MSIADDETKAALRRVCDRYAGTAANFGQAFHHLASHGKSAPVTDRLARLVSRDLKPNSFRRKVMIP
jgi:hypothetical protein